MNHVQRIVLFVLLPALGRKGLSYPVLKVGHLFVISGVRPHAAILFDSKN